MLGSWVRNSVLGTGYGVKPIKPTMENIEKLNLLKTRVLYSVEKNII